MRTASTLARAVAPAVDPRERLARRSAEPVSLQQLQLLAAEIQDITHQARRLAAQCPVASLESCAHPGSWSVAECLDHLAQSAFAFLPAMTDAIAAAPRLTANRRLRTGVLASLFIGNLQPPYRIRLKVLPQLEPQCRDFAAAWQRFEESQARLLETIRSASGLAIDKVSIKSPVYARIRYNVYGALRMLIAHEHRHLWQIEQILKTLGQRTAPTVVD
jgi:hypothetical protein